MNAHSRIEIGLLIGNEQLANIFSVMKTDGLFAVCLLTSLKDPRQDGNIDIVSV